MLQVSAMLVSLFVVHAFRTFFSPKKYDDKINDMYSCHIEDEEHLLHIGLCVIRLFTIIYFEYWRYLHLCQLQQILVLTHCLLYSYIYIHITCLVVASTPQIHGEIAGLTQLLRPVNKDFHKLSLLSATK